MTNPLVEYEKNAFDARRNKNFQVAISLYEKIVVENPNWEHGEAFYNLAGCYEDIGELEKAEENYLNALNIQPEYYIFVGGYASFLYQFSEPQTAFDWYLKLLKIEKENKPLEWTSENQWQLDDIKINLFALGEKLDWSKDEVETRIANYLT
jgi:tetratricopeptide (TPR) repeat protein